MKRFTSILLAGTVLAAPAAATSISVTIQNNSAANGLYFTPFLTVFHAGDYDPFNAREAASAGLEELAELGSTGTAAAEAAAPGRLIDTITDPEGVGPAVGAPPIFDPGATETFTLHLDPVENQYLTLLSMVIPSNDTFISGTFKIFDDAGNFIADALNNLGRASIYDAGTEINALNGDGQAFNTADGVGGGSFGDNPDGTSLFDEGGFVHLSTDSELLTLFGQPLPTGATNVGDLTSFDNILTVSFAEVAPVPLPAAGWGLIAGLGGLGVMARRKKKAAQKA